MTSLLGLLKSKVDRSALVAVCPHEDRISYVRVRNPRDLPPSLELCSYSPVDSVGIQGAEIARITREHDLNRQYCVSTLDVGSYSLLLVEAPDVPATELRAAIRWRVRDLIDFHIDDAVIDAFDVPNQRTTGKSALMYAVVARTASVKRQIDLLLAAGLQLEVIDIPELAIRNITALIPEDVAGVALLYLEARRGLIAVTRQSTLYLSRQINIGSDDIGENINQGKAVIDRIVIEIQRSLDYYESHFSQPAITNIVIAPLAREISGLDRYLAEQLGISVRFLDINSLIDTEHSIDPLTQHNCLLAVGAALREESKTL